MVLYKYQYKQAKPRRIITIIRYITKRKMAERTFKTSENRFRIVSELTSYYVYAFRVEPDGSLVNQWASNQEIGATFHIFFPTTETLL